MKYFLILLTVILASCSLLFPKNKSEKYSDTSVKATQIERNIANSNIITDDYPEAYAEANLEKVISMTEDVQDYILDLNSLIDLSSVNVGYTSDVGENENYCTDLWNITCSIDFGIDPTGKSISKKVIDFKDIAPGYMDKVFSKIYYVLDYIYNNDDEYRSALRRAFRFKSNNYKAALQCMSKYMVHKSFIEYSSFPLDCFNRHKMLLRDIVMNQNSLYFENRIRRAVRYKFPRTPYLRSIKETIIPRVKSILINKLSKLSINDTIKQHIINRVREIKYSAKECKNFQTDNAFYQRDGNLFTLCWGSFLKNSSIFPAIKTIAHELTHAFDPCTLSKININFTYSDSGKLSSIVDEYPFGKSLSCISKEKSVGARMISNPKDICKSQFGEAFSDLMAVEVLAEYVEKYEKERIKNSSDYRLGYANVFRSACSRAHSKTRFEHKYVHPRAEDRTNFILGTHPLVRKQMGCKKIAVPGGCSVVSSDQD